MKKFQILILGVLIVFTLSDDDSYSTCSTSTSNPSKKTCNGYKFTEIEKTAGYKYCCYVEGGGEKFCVGLNQEGYDQIGKNKDKYKDGKIECISSYLELGLLAAIIALIF